MHLLSSVRLLRIPLAINADTYNYDIRAQLVASGHNPTATKLHVTVTLSPGVHVGDAGGLGWALRTGASSWHAGSTILIVSNGFIEGRGGNGGAGGATGNNGGTATDGGNAIAMNHPLTIDNTNGFVRAGGGGGGGGSGATLGGGHGGGGGAGSPDGTPGADASTPVIGGGTGGGHGVPGANGVSSYPWNGGGGGGAGLAVVTGGFLLTWSGGGPGTGQVSGSVL